jgi:hypothetical protein
MRTETDYPPLASRISWRTVDRVVRCALILVLASPQVVHAAEAEAENLERLRSIPREERLALWEKLNEFDALSQTERSAIRSLDERIGQLPPAMRANYGSVLRRYHHWVQGLTDAQRNELNAAPPGERMKLVTKLHAAERSAPRANSTPLFLQVSDFSSALPLFETALRLKVWFDLTPEKRAEIEKIPSVAEQQKRLAELRQQVKEGLVNRISKSDESALMEKIEENPQLKNWLSSPLRKADPTKHEKMKRRMAVNYYFLEHPPAAVESGHLMRFQTALPSWYRGQFDYLPSEEARRRLTILYRLVFPSPGEIPEIHVGAPPGRPAAMPPRTPSLAPKPARPAPRPDTPTGTSPF